MVFDDRRGALEVSFEFHPLRRGDVRDRPEPGGLVVVDEASMAATGKLLAIPWALRHGPTRGDRERPRQQPFPTPRAHPLRVRVELELPGR